MMVKFVYTENGKEKSSLDEHKKRVEIMEHNKRLNEMYPVSIKVIKEWFDQEANMKFKILLNGIILEQTDDIDKMKTLLSRQIRKGNIHYIKNIFNGKHYSKSTNLKDFYFDWNEWGIHTLSIFESFERATDGLKIEYPENYFNR